MRAYDPAEVNLIVGGVAITGYAESSFIKAARMEDSFTEYTGAKGETAMAESCNKNGEITVTLERTSPSCEYLYDLSNKSGVLMKTPYAEELFKHCVISPKVGLFSFNDNISAGMELISKIKANSKGGGGKNG